MALPTDCSADEDEDDKDQDQGAFGEEISRAAEDGGEEGEGCIFWNRKKHIAGGGIGVDADGGSNGQWAMGAFR